VLASRPLQLLQIGDIQLVMEQEDRLGAEAGDLEQLGQAGRGLIQKLLVDSDPAGLEVLLHLVGNSPPHSRYGLEPALPANCDDVLRQALYGPGGFAVGYDLEAILGLQLQQLGHLIEYFCNLAVFHGEKVRDCLVIIISCRWLWAEKLGRAKACTERHSRNLERSK